jgi:predicted transcriptional regulator
MKSLTDRMALAKIVLHELKRQPLCRTELEKRTTMKAGTHAAFESIFQYLAKERYVEKSSTNHRATYLLSKKGVKLLEAMQ